MSENLFLTDFDAGAAVIEPSMTSKNVESMPKSCIAVFSHMILEEYVEKYNPEVLTYLGSVEGDFPVYKMNIDNHEFAFYMPHIGAPMAAGELEEIIALGCESFVFFGSCGVLRHDIADGHLIVPKTAIRDEGMSFHYAEPSNEIELEPELVSLAEQAMEELGLPYVSGKTWTTDAFYRETPRKMQRAKDMGAVCVEMECSALTAVAKYRGVRFVQFLWSADNLDAPEWDKRSGHTRGSTVSEKCMAAAVAISKKMLT